MSHSSQCPQCPHFPSSIPIPAHYMLWSSSLSRFHSLFVFCPRDLIPISYQHSSLISLRYSHLTLVFHRTRKLLLPLMPLRRLPLLVPLLRVPPPRRLLALIRVLSHLFLLPTLLDPRTKLVNAGIQTTTPPLAPKHPRRPSPSRMSLLTLPRNPEVLLPQLTS